MHCLQKLKIDKNGVTVFLILRGRTCVFADFLFKFSLLERAWHSGLFDTLLVGRGYKIIANIANVILYYRNICKSYDDFGE